MNTAEKIKELTQKIAFSPKLKTRKPARKTLAEALYARTYGGAKATLTSIASRMPDPHTTQAAREARLRRMLDSLNPRKNINFLTLLALELAGRKQIIIALDRTGWKRYDVMLEVLIAGIEYKNRLIPISWIAKCGKGNTSFSEWLEVVEPLIRALESNGVSPKEIYLVADREFCSLRLAEIVRQLGANFVLRIKSNMVFFDANGRKVRPFDIVAKAPRGTILFLTELESSDGFVCNVVAVWGKNYKEPLILATNLENPQEALRLYARRWSIEPMFRDFKSVHFDIEETGVTYPNRLSSLIFIIVLAYILFVFIGVLKEREREERECKRGRRRKRKRRISVFLLGFRAFVFAVFSGSFCLFMKLVSALSSFVGVLWT